MMRRIFLFLIVFCCGLGVLGKEFRFGNSRVEFVFEPGTGYALREICNRETGRSIMLRGNENYQGIWRAYVNLDASVTRSIYAAQGPAAAEIQKYDGGQKLLIRWKKLRPYNEVAVNVTVSVDLPDDESMGYWGIEIQSLGNKDQVPSSVQFPNLDGIQSLGDSQLVWPHHLGCVMKNPAENLQGQLHIRHPAPWSMQFVAYHGSSSMQASAKAIQKRARCDANTFIRGRAGDETGLYISPLDPTHSYKLVFIHSGRRPGASFRLWMDHYIIQQKQRYSAAEPAGMSWKMPYRIQLGTYAGGCKEACDIYRRWALQQPWTARGPLRTAADPENPRSAMMTDNVFWGGLYEWPAKMIPEAAAFKQYFKVPSNVLWYRYNVARFDMSNPEYFPVNPYLHRGFRELSRMNIPVTPYICGNIWGMDTESWERYKAAPEAVLEGNGAIKTWDIQNHKNAWMNPTSPVWQKRLTDVTDYLFGSWGSTGVYLDVLAAASHSIGGGTAWADGTRKIISNIRENADRNIRKSTLMISEGITDAYLQDLDGFLTLDWTRGPYPNMTGMDVFPLYAYVYHDFVSYFGGDLVQFHAYKDNSWQVGASVFCGMQPMIFAPDIAAPASAPVIRENDEFLREVMQAWHSAAWKYLNSGRGIEMAQVPDRALVGRAPYGLISRPYRKNVKLFFNRTVDWNSPAVMGSAWRGFDGTDGLVAVNITEEDQQAEFVFSTEVRKDKARVLWQTWPGPVKKIGRLQDLAGHRFSLKKGRIAVFEICGDRAPVLRPLLEDREFHCFKAQKDNSFRQYRAESGRIWGCEDSLLANAVDKNQNTLTLMQENDGMNAVRNTGYHRYVSIYQNLPVPFRPEDKTHFLAVKTPYVMDGLADLVVRTQGKAIYGTAAVHRPSKLTGTGDSRFFVYDSIRGTARFFRNTAELAPGTYRIAAWPASSAPELEDTSAGIEEVVQSFAGRAGLDRYRWSVQEADKEKYLTSAFISNGLVFVLTGVRQTSREQDCWALPRHPLPLRQNLYLKDDAVYVRDSIRLMDAGNGAELKRTGRLAYEFLCTDGTVMEGFYPVQQKTVIRRGGRKYSLYGHYNIFVNRPFMVEEHWKTKNMFSVTAGESFIDNDIKIFNAFPGALDVTVEADLPEGITFELLNPEALKQLKAFGVCHPELKISADRFCPQGWYNLEFFVNYTGRRDSAYKVICPVWVRNSGFKAPVSPRGGAKMDSALNRRRDCMAVFQGRKGEALHFSLKAVNTRGPKKLSWKISSCTGAPAASGVLEVSGRKNLAEFQFLPKTTDFYRLDIDIPKYHGDILNETMGWNLQLKEDVRLFWDCSPVSGFAFAARNKPMTLAFHVPAGARRFSVRGFGGWGIWPSGFRIMDASGKVILDRKGMLRDLDNWIQVPENQDDAVWKIELFAGEDLGISMHGDVSPYLWFEK